MAAKVARTASQALGPVGLASRHVTRETIGCRRFVECSSWEPTLAVSAPVSGSLRIGAFSRKVGVSAAVLRAWESRYGLFDPDRTRAATGSTALRRSGASRACARCSRAAWRRRSPPAWCSPRSASATPAGARRGVAHPGRRRRAARAGRSAGRARARGGRGAGDAPAPRHAPARPPPLRAPDGRDAAAGPRHVVARGRGTAGAARVRPGRARHRSPCSCSPWRCDAAAGGSSTSAPTPRPRCSPTSRRSWRPIGSSSASTTRRTRRVSPAARRDDRLRRSARRRRGDHPR